MANSIGPIVKVGVTEVDFGQIDVLKEYSRTITIKNESKIEADFHAFTKNKVSVFRPLQKHGILKPDASMDIDVICTADDATKF